MTPLDKLEALKSRLGEGFVIGEDETHSYKVAMAGIDEILEDLKPVTEAQKWISHGFEVTYDGGVISINGRKIADHSELPKENQRLFLENQRMQQVIAELKSEKLFTKYRQIVKYGLELITRRHDIDSSIKAHADSALREMF